MSQQPDYAAILEQNTVLEAKNVSLERQLAWYRKQVFGEKSERRLVNANPDQLSLDGLLSNRPEPPPG